MLHHGLLKARQHVILQHIMKVDPNLKRVTDTISVLDDKIELSQPQLSQPLCTAIQIALVDLLSSWGVTPSAVVGHSSGEIAAAYAAGSLTKEDAIIVAFYRGHICKKPSRMGTMAAVGLGKADVSPFLAPGVVVACENSASSVTLSGDTDTLNGILASIQKTNERTFVRKLQVEMAYHSGITILCSLYDEVMHAHLF
jgi:acyl transferase domain-containing protein